MKILVLTNLYPPDFLGGYELGCRQAVQALSAAGHEVAVLTSVPRNGPVPPADGVRRTLRLADIYDVYSYHHTLGAWPSRVVQAFGVQAGNVHALAELVEEFRPDVAYVWNTVGLGGLGLLAALQKLGVPWVMHLMDRIPAELCGFGRGTPVKPAVAAAFRAGCRGRFLCCSRTTLDEIAAFGIDVADRAVVVPNWVTTAGTHGRDDYMPGGRLRVMTAGSLAASKGIGILIDAAAELASRGVANVGIDIYGFGDDLPFRTRVEKLGVGHTVRLCGPRTQAELDRLYPAYDLFAFPTWEREPFAFAQLEAMAHGCVPLMSRVCGNAEWFVDGTDVLKADRTAVGFADALAAVAAGEVPLAEMGRRGAAVVRSKFHLDALLPAITRELTLAARSDARPTGSAADVYRLALLAEKAFTAAAYDAVA